MSKLNLKKPSGTSKKVATVAAKHNLKVELSKNHNPQFAKQAAQRLYELTVSTLLGKDTYYATSDDKVRELKEVVKEAVGNDMLDFVANTAVHARTAMHIRSFPVVLVVEFARELREQNKTYEHMRQLVVDVIQRADQITDMYAYALAVFGDKNKVPMAIKRGVADAMNNFNEYHFAKWG